MRARSLVLSSLAVPLALGCADAVHDASDLAHGSEQAILDGELAAFAPAEGTVALVDTQSWKAFCTGTLIAPDVVLTAAHCLVEIDPDRNVIAGVYAAASMRIVAGVTNVSATTPADGHAVAEVRPHPEFGIDPLEDPIAGFGGLHDVGLVVLAEPTTEVVPVAVLEPEALARELTLGRDLRIEGYGVSTPNGPAGLGALRIAEVPIVRLGVDELVAGRLGTPDTCPGDSGGPAYLERDGQLTLVGITSRALATAVRACGEGGIYTLASAYLDFIRTAAPDAGTTRPDAEPTPDAGDDAEDLEVDTESSIDPTTAGEEQDRSGARSVTRAPTLHAKGCAVSGPTGQAAHASWLLAFAAAVTWTRRRRRGSPSEPGSSRAAREPAAREPGSDV